MSIVHISSASRKRREAVRKKAGKLFQQGVSKAEVARRCRVSRTAAGYWYSAWKKKGVRGLDSKGHPGFVSSLSEAQRQTFAKAVVKGPLRYGYETNLWTLSRLSAVMEQVTGVRFSDVWTWHIVRSLGFTPQKPQVKARERDEKAIAQWKAKRLPGLKKMGGNAWIFSGLRG